MLCEKHALFKALLTLDIRLLWQPNTALFPPAPQGGHQRPFQLHSQSPGWHTVSNGCPSLAWQIGKSTSSPSHFAYSAFHWPPYSLCLMVPGGSPPAHWRIRWASLHPLPSSVLSSWSRQVGCPLPAGQIETMCVSCCCQVNSWKDFDFIFCIRSKFGGPAVEYSNLCRLLPS